jgi:large subunit ribosomal protein L3
MGNQRVTVQNLKVLEVNNETGVVVVHGAVPGPKGALVKIQDAIKKRGASPRYSEKTLTETLERNPGVEEKLEEARKRHLEMKDMRLMARTESTTPRAV